MNKRMSEETKRKIGLANSGPHLNRRKERIEIKCNNPECHNTWLTLRSQIAHKKYCSTNCSKLRYKDHSKMLKEMHLSGRLNAKGSNNPNFGNHSPLPNSTKMKMKVSAIERLRRDGSTFKPSKQATHILNEMEKTIGPIEREFPIYHPIFGIKFYDGRIGNCLIEIDGKYWHSMASHRINDANKNILAKISGFTLTRISI